MSESSHEVPDGTYVELVRSLYRTLLPATIMAISFGGVAALVVPEAGDAVLAWLAAASIAAALARLAVLILSRRTAADPDLDTGRARVLERRFAQAYLSFAAVFGVFSARGLAVAPADSYALLVGLLFGYGAGVAAGVSLRPKISVPSVLLAIVPSIAVTLVSGQTDVAAIGALLAAFLGGGVHSMLSRYRSAVNETTMRRLMSTLARRDELTGLSNRLSLRERFDESLTGAGSPHKLAVHCLDLDRFKPVNDNFGHPVGDQLLQAVSARLAGALRRGDFAARTGGDEFIVLQFGVDLPAAAELMARRIVRAVEQPFEIEGHTIAIGTSVGYVLSVDQGNDLDHLVACADAALVRVKRAGGGIAAYDAPLDADPPNWRLTG